MHTSDTLLLLPLWLLHSMQYAFFFSPAIHGSTFLGVGVGENGTLVWLSRANFCGEREAGAYRASAGEYMSA